MTHRGRVERETVLVTFSVLAERRVLRAADIFPRSSQERISLPGGRTDGNDGMHATAAPVPNRRDVEGIKRLK